MTATVSQIKTINELLLHILANYGKSGNSIKKVQLFHSAQIIHCFRWLPFRIEF